MPPTQPVPPNQTVSAPAYQLPPKPPVSHTGRNIALIVIGVIIVLLAVAAGLYYFTPLGAKVMGMFVSDSVPAELQSASFLSDSATGNTIIYQFPASGKTSTDAGAVIVSAMQNSSGSARITRSADGTFKVIVGTTVVLQDATPRIGIDLSSDGKTVVFAAASGTMPFISPAITSTLNIGRKDWNVILYIPFSHKSITIGTGVSPFFVDNSHVAWLAPAGLAVIDLATGKSTVLVPDVTGQASAATLVSPDHTVFAWYMSTTKTMMPYKITATSATALPKTLIPGSLRWVALGNDAFYELHPTPTNNEIEKQVFGGTAAVIGHLKVPPFISRIWLGSI